MTMITKVRERECQDGSRVTVWALHPEDEPRFKDRLPPTRPGYRRLFTGWRHYEDKTVIETKDYRVQDKTSKASSWAFGPGED